MTLVLGATLAVAALLTGSTSQATVLQYVPADSVVYGELRLDLPGDQRQAAGEFLSKFPGFADQAALDTKLDEALDQLVGEASDGKQTFTQDIKPWFDGEFAFAVGPLPKDALSGESSAAAADARALILLSVKDQAAASAWFTERPHGHRDAVHHRDLPGRDDHRRDPGRRQGHECRVRDPRRQRRRRR